MTMARHCFPLLALRAPIDGGNSMQFNPMSFRRTNGMPISRICRRFCRRVFAWRGADRRRVFGNEAGAGRSNGTVQSVVQSRPTTDRPSKRNSARHVSERPTPGEQADAAEVAVFQFLNRRFVDAAEQATADPLPEPSPAPIGPTIRPNPEWVTMNRELSAMRQRRSELLVKLTPAHPAVQALDSQIASVEDQLASIPAELPVDPSEIPNVSPAGSRFSAASTAKNDSAANVPSAEMQQDYRNLLIAAGNARENYRTALEAENTEWAVLRNGGTSSLALDRAGTVDLRPSDAEPQSLASGDRRISYWSDRGVDAILSAVCAANWHATFASEEIEAVGSADNRPERSGNRSDAGFAGAQRTRGSRTDGQDAELKFATGL